MVIDMHYPVIRTESNSMATIFERQHSAKMPQHRTRRYRRKVLENHVQERSPFSYAYRSVANDRHPLRNEDSTLVDEQTGLVAVFDGVGGSAAAEIASQTAARATLEGWKRILTQHQRWRKVYTMLEDCDQRDYCAILEQLILDADEQVRIDGAQRAGTDDLATTVAMAVFCKNHDTREYTMISAHVGDSRIYLLHEQEELQRITNDDGLLTKLVENQIVDEQHAYQIDQATQADQLSDMDYRYFRLRGGITQAIGGPIPPIVHIHKTIVYPGDRILLCTDGIHDNLTDEEIEDILRNTPRPAFARRLVELSQQRSRQDYSLTIRAKPDDMSAIVVTCRF
jgi:serine/threonine protein phosphatase PrpC